MRNDGNTAVGGSGRQMETQLLRSPSNAIDAGCVAVVRKNPDPRRLRAGACGGRRRCVGIVDAGAGRGHNGTASRRHPRKGSIGDASPDSIVGKLSVDSHCSVVATRSKESAKTRVRPSHLPNGAFVTANRKPTERDSSGKQFLTVFNPTTFVVSSFVCTHAASSATSAGPSAPAVVVEA
jgi:hypothetical protein